MSIDTIEFAEHRSRTLSPSTKPEIDIVVHELDKFSSTDTKVRASRPIKAETVELSLLDAYAPKVWVPQTHFWRAAANVDIEEIYQTLKKSLSRTLSEVPVLAGKLECKSKDPRDVVISIEPLAGVDLAYEDLSDHASIPSYDEIAVAGFPISDLITPLSARVALGTVYQGAPVSAFKLNKLNGGIALSCAFNHVFADATTVADIQKLWASHTADVGNGLPEREYFGKIDVAACRVRLSIPRPGSSEDFSSPHYKLFPASHSSLALPEKQEQQEAAMKLIAEAKLTDADDTETPKWCMWRFSPAKLAELKQECSAGLSNGEWVSTINALIGLFWSRVLSSKPAPSDRQSTSTLLFPANIRTRLGLNPQYLGNAVDILAAESSIAELTSSSGWTAAARSIRRGIDSWTAESWDSWLKTAQQLPADQALCPDPLVLMDQHNMIFNDYSKSELCQLEWGSKIGKPDATRYMRPASMMKGCATAIIIYPRLADDSLEVAMAATDSLRDALLNDGVFRRYATLTGCFA